ncbi:MAG: hypothetical protein Q7T69_03190 [Rhodoferax sp.]|nr:hypothetical protein [Rhodoferax sp.]
MSKLLGYLNLLDTDSEARAAHAADPKAAMTQFGLSDAEHEAVLSGDKTAISKLAGVDLKDGLTSQGSCVEETK